MKRKISLILCIMIVLGCFSGCMVKKTGPFSTGENIDSLCTCEVENITDERPIERKTGKTFLYSRNIEIKNHGNITELYKTRIDFPSVNNNIILAEIINVQRLRIHNNYYLLYKYKIKECYYGNLKKNQEISVIENDWSIDNDPFNIGYHSDFVEQCVYPQIGESIIAFINKMDKASLENTMYTSLCPKEKEYFTNNYINIGSTSNEVLFDKNMNFILIPEDFQNCSNLSDAEKIIKDTLKKPKKKTNIITVNPDNTSSENDIT